MRVLTQNLWGLYYPLPGPGIGKARPGAAPPAALRDRLAVLAGGLRALDPDLAAFQEAICRDGYDQVADLLGPGYHLAHQTRREADGSGISLASRWPLGQVHEVDLQLTPRTKGFLSVALVAEIEVPPPIGPLLFVNHKPNFELALEHERGLQALATASHSIAASLGYTDGEQIPVDEMIAAIGRIAAAVDLPVTADLEAGYGDPGLTVRKAIGATRSGGGFSSAWSLGRFRTDPPTTKVVPPVVRPGSAKHILTLRFSSAITWWMKSYARRVPNTA